MKLKDRNISNVTHIATILAKKEKQSFLVIPCSMGCDIVVKSQAYKTYEREVIYTAHEIIIKDQSGKVLSKSIIDKGENVDNKLKTPAKQKKVQSK